MSDLAFYAEEVAILISKAGGIAPHIRFELMPSHIDDDGQRHWTFDLQFGGKRRQGIQAMYSDGKMTSVASKSKRGIMHYDVAGDTTFIIIGRHKRRGWVIEELIFTNRRAVNVEKLVPCLRGLYNPRKLSHRKFEAVITAIEQL